MEIDFVSSTTTSFAFRLGNVVQMLSQLQVFCTVFRPVFRPGLGQFWILDFGFWISPA
jgi:hypothetical protein